MQPDLEGVAKGVEKSKERVFKEVFKEGSVKDDTVAQVNSDRDNKMDGNFIVSKRTIKFRALTPFLGPLLGPF